MMDVIDELIALATSQGCEFGDDFKEKTVDSMTAQSENPSTMYQDFMARRPMEVETYLGSPIKLATEAGIKIPRIETLYAMLHHVNTTNQNRQPQEPNSPVSVHPPPRMSSAPPPRAMMNGMRGGGGRGMPPPRRGPPSTNAVPRVNGHPPPRGPPPATQVGSYDEPNLDEFSHLVLYEDALEDSGSQSGGSGPPVPNGTPNGLALKERELALRQRELQIKEMEMNMRRNNGRRASMARDNFDDMDGDDYFGPMDARGPPPVPQIDPDSIDMMSVTSRRNRKAPNYSQIRKNPEVGNSTPRPPSALSRVFGGARSRTSARIMQEMPNVNESLLDNPMMSYSSNRYGNVDRRVMHNESRANSLTAGRINEMGPLPGFPPPPPSRRASRSPATPGGRGMGRPGPPPDGFPIPPNMLPPGSRPSPPGMVKAPVPRYPPGQGNAVAPQQVEQQVGVSNLYPAKGPPTNVRSLTGSGSTSAGSGDSGGSANIDSENSAQSSQSSLAQQRSMPILSHDTR